VFGYDDIGLNTGLVANSCFGMVFVWESVSGAGVSAV
jgi:hypothetical protein